MTHLSVISPKKNENWWYLPVLKRLYITRGYSGYGIMFEKITVMYWVLGDFLLKRLVDPQPQGKGLDDPLRRFTKRTVRHGPSVEAVPRGSPWAPLKSMVIHGLEDFFDGLLSWFGKDIVKFPLNLEDTAILGILLALFGMIYVVTSYRLPSLEWWLVKGIIPKWP